MSLLYCTVASQSDCKLNVKRSLTSRLNYQLNI